MLGRNRRVGKSAWDASVFVLIKEGENPEKKAN